MDIYEKEPTGTTPEDTAFDEATGTTPEEPDLQAESCEEAPDMEALRKKLRRGKAWRRAGAGALALVLVAGSCGLTAVGMNHRWEARERLLTQEMNQRLASLESRVAAAESGKAPGSLPGSQVSYTGELLTPGQVYARNVNSVVAISNQGVTRNIYGQMSQTASSGSGFILTEDGYVVTNQHVVAGAQTLTVILSDGTEYPAKLVGEDSTNDVAVLKIEATGLPAVKLGSSDELAVGDQVVAIGNPLGELTSTQTVGYISAKDRDVSTGGSLINMLQTDAAINSGNSGGPLFNMRGEVVGITTAKYSGTTASGAAIEGIGFAIPVDDVKGIIQDLTSYGYVTGAYLGVMVRQMDPAAAQMYGLPLGAYVDSVNEGSCAQLAGIQAKDIITNFAGYPVGSLTDLTLALRKFQAGDTVTVTIYRAGQELSLSVVLDEKPHDQPQQALPDTGESLPSEGSYEDWYNYFAPFFGNGEKTD